MPADNTLQFNPYQLPKNTTIPGAFGQDFFDQLQKTLGAEQQNQANNLLDFQKKSNLVGQGDINTGLLSQVLGSPQEQINSEILPTALSASSTGQGQQYQTQLQAIQFQQQLQAMQQAFQEQESLMNLYASLLPRGFGDVFSRNFTQGLGQDIGQAIPTLVAGGIGGLL